MRLISGILLLIAIGNHPYSYYQLLRLVVCGSSLYSGWIFSMLKRHDWTWFFFIIGILFNPIFPVYLDKSIWQIVDIVSSIIIFYSLSIKLIIYDEKNI